MFTQEMKTAKPTITLKQNYLKYYYKMLTNHMTQTGIIDEHDTAYYCCRHSCLLLQVAREAAPHEPGNSCYYIVYQHCEH